MAASGVMLALAFDREAALETECDDDYCTDVGVDLAREGEAFSTLSGVFAVSGLVVTGVGIWIWHDAGDAAVATIGGGGSGASGLVGLRGSF
jgi:hypothetical protein